VSVEAVARRMTALLGERPRTFYELVRELDDVEYRALLRAWGALRERRLLARDPAGRYVLRPGVQLTRDEPPAAARGTERRVPGGP
jgi:hypothetical protein